MVDRVGSSILAGSIYIGDSGQMADAGAGVGTGTGAGAGIKGAGVS
jgi:hypothetical protein